MLIHFWLGFAGSTFSCCINTDGVKIFKSSKFSVWPLFLSINELDYKIRRDNTILVGLWFGQSKATIYTFLQPAIDVMNSMSKEPLEWKVGEVSIWSTVIFPMVAADSAARCQIQGIKQYNGESSCTFCTAPGKQHGVGSRQGSFYFVTIISM